MFVYGIIIRLYYFAILCAALFNTKAKKWIEGRRNWRKQLIAIDFSKNKWVWFHCSSFGEFQDGKSLMEAFAQQHPAIKILLTFFSSTGYELQKDYSGSAAVFYLPLDTAGNAAFLLDTVKPVAVFFIRHDIWPNYVVTCAKNGIPSFLVSFTLNERSAFLKFPVRSFYRKIFLRFSCIFVQHAGAEAILKQNGFASKIVVAGNARIDRIIETGNQVFENKILSQFVREGFCCIGGSTHAKDRAIFLEAYHQLKSENIKWILVPHEIDTVEIEKSASDLKSEMTLYSELKEVNADNKLLWVDRVGILAHLYRYTDIAFIGGGFSKAGIHNILEPALYGCAICFGPNHRHYTEAIDLMNAGGSSVVHNSSDLVNFIMQLKNDSGRLKEINVSNKQYVLNASNSAKKMMEYLEQQKLF